ncbi:GNAT family N-acetyltransferase [Nocardiopsis lambiniae]|uniref:GNAT family N-acetyltransferase n=1 Tax=Nocardiopsis lambiniae TaxID=3075539 RepID=A0ABU2MAU9_9ACTN|nr:GNAT family N-acetyltransferase [Nocardiopsis sp. DSM 44743]MDT0329737.1 GNAT family N-acetyltransferase [Nocardiopsis sp. DSM 44743]
MSLTTWYLEMTDLGDLRPAREPEGDVRFVRVGIPSPAFSRFLYERVGGDWQWVDRLTWTPDRWRAWVDRPAVETWVLYQDGAPAGYAELEAQDDGAVEILYFGLMPGFLGRGLGGHTLTLALRRAWDLADRLPGREPTRRVRLHTCSLDGEHALANYRARGLEIYRTTHEQVDTSTKGRVA